MGQPRRVNGWLSTGASNLLIKESTWSNDTRSMRWLWKVSKTEGWVSESTRGSWCARPYQMSQSQLIWRLWGMPHVAYPREYKGVFIPKPFTLPHFSLPILSLLSITLRSLSNFHPSKPTTMLSNASKPSFRLKFNRKLQPYIWKFQISSTSQEPWPLTLKP